MAKSKIKNQEKNKKTKENSSSYSKLEDAQEEQPQKTDENQLQKQEKGIFELSSSDDEDGDENGKQIDLKNNDFVTKSAIWKDGDLVGFNIDQIVDENEEARKDR